MDWQWLETPTGLWIGYGVMIAAGIVAGVLYALCNGAETADQGGRGNGKARRDHRDIRRGTSRADVQRGCHAWIAADYQAGLSARRVARKHRTSTRKVMAEIRRRGIPIHKAGERKGHPSRTRKPHCKRCSILLEVVAYHEDGVCCICLAEERGVDTGTWVWATAD